MGALYSRRLAHQPFLSLGRAPMGTTSSNTSREVSLYANVLVKRATSGSVDVRVVEKIKFNFKFIVVAKCTVTK